MQSRWLTWSLGAVLCLVLALSSSADAAFPGRNGRIAAGGMFLAGGCGEFGAIAIMRPDGTRRREVGCRRHGPASINGPEWSADGRELLYNDDGRPAMVAASEWHPRLVPLGLQPTDPFGLGKPSFAPDGRHFLFERGPWIWRAATDGTARKRLRQGRLPRWSPDGVTSHSVV